MALRMVRDVRDIIPRYSSVIYWHHNKKGRIYLRIHMWGAFATPAKSMDFTGHM
jgi:hypothetical protein